MSGKGWVFLALTALLAGCESTPPAAASTPPSMSPSQSLASPPSAVLVTLASEHGILDLGPYGVGNLACDGRSFAFTTSSTPRQSRYDVVKVANLDGSDPRVAARATHGGTLTDSVPLSPDWLLFLEYAQSGDTQAASFWYLQATNLHDGRIVALAAATAPPATLELPTYALSGSQAVWAEMRPDGTQALFTQDLASGTRNQVRLPATTRPFSPSIAGSTVVFIDDRTSAPASPDTLHGGSLQRIDLAAPGIHQLEQPTAYAPLTNGRDVVWTVDAPDPLHSGPSLVWSPVIASIDGGGKRRLAPVGDLMLLSDTFAAWPDHETRDLFAYRLGSGRLAEIRVAGRDDLRAVLALCGATLLYALPPEADGGRSVIRSLDLEGIVPR